MSAVSDSGGLRLVRRNALAIYGAYATAILSGLVVTPIIFRALGAEAYGVWSFIGATTIYLSLLDFGVGPSIVRFAAVERGRRDMEATSALASVGLVLYAIVGAVTMGAGVALAWLVPEAVSAPDDLVWPARIATLLTVAGIAARFPLGLFANLLLAQQRFDVTSLAALVATVAHAVAVVAIFTQTGGLVLLAAVVLAGTLLRLAIPLLWVPRELPGLRLRRALVSRDVLRRLTAMSADNFLIHLSGKVVFSADVIIVGVVLGARAAGLYGVAAKLFALAAGVATAGTNMLLPALSELEGAEDEARQRNLLLSGLRAGMALVVIVAVPFVVLPDLILEGWLGSARDFDVGETAPALALLAGALLLYQPVHVLTQYLVARGRQRAVARALVAIGAANIGLSVVLADVVGIWGVALSTLVTEAIAAGVVLPVLVLRASGVRLQSLAVAASRPLVPAAVLALPLLVGLGRGLELDSLEELIPLALVWTPLAALAVWRFGFAPGERASLARKLLPGGRGGQLDERLEPLA